MRSYGTNQFAVSSAPALGGWGTDFLNWVKKAGTTGLTLWTQYQQGLITKEQLEAALKKEQQQSETSSQLVKVALFSAIGIAALLVLTRK